MGIFHFFFFSFFSSFAQGFVVTPAFPVLFFSSIIFLPFVTAMLNQVYFTFDSFQVKSVFLYSIMTNMIVLIPNLFFYIFILILLTRNLIENFLVYSNKTSFIVIENHCNLKKNERERERFYHLSGKRGWRRISMRNKWSKCNIGNRGLEGGIRKIICV